jgi:metal-sulfur cluster biosynthetic enzyme/rhodanese-related sulfurtransferase
MLIAAAVAVLGLAVGLWRALRRVADAERQIADLRRLRRDLESLREDVARDVGVTRAHLAAVAAGDPPSRDAIVRGLPYRDVGAAEALALYEGAPDLFVLDVRTPAEHRNGYIPRAVLIPLDELEDRLSELPAKGTPMLVHCAAGARSAAACELLGRHGYTGLLNLAGGMHMWTGPRETAASTPPPASALAGTAIAFHGGAITADQVVGAIRTCFDPEIPLNVYDLGLVYGIDIDEGGIAVRMTLTSEGCPSARAIPEDVRTKIAALGQPNVKVDVVWDPPWHPSRISDEGKEKLGLS